MSSETAYLFRHAVLRDAAYQLQLPGDRARLHALAFELVEEVSGGRPPAHVPNEAGSETLAAHPVDSVAEELSEHALRAQSGAEDRGRWAALRRDYLRRAAEHAERHFQQDSAHRLWLLLAESTTGAPRGIALRRAGVAAGQAGRTAAAEELLSQSLFELRSAGARAAQAVTFGELGTLGSNTGKSAEAERCFARARELFESSGADERDKAVVGINLGILFRRTSRLAEAEAEFRGALGQVRALGDRPAEAAVLGNLAGICRVTGRPAESARLIRRALVLHRRTGRRENYGVELGNIGMEFADRDPARAESCYREALAIHREVGDRRSVGIVLGNLASLHFDQRQYDKAERVILEALPIHREVGNARSEGIALGILARVLFATGRESEAEAPLEKALSIHRRVGNKASLAGHLGTRSSLYRWQGRFGDAAKALEESVGLYVELGNRRSQGLQQAALARTLVEAGRIEEAKVAWSEAAALIRELGDPDAVERWGVRIGEACAKAGVAPFV